MKTLIVCWCLALLAGCHRNNENEKIVLSCSGIQTSEFKHDDGTNQELAPKELNFNLTVTYMPVLISTDSSQSSDVWVIHSDNPDFSFVTNNHRSENDVRHMSVVVDEKNIRVNGSFLTKGHDETVKVLINRISGEISKQNIKFTTEFANPVISEFKGICQKGS
jgi:hypothetical protein